jgi:hypothetical protein
MTTTNKDKVLQYFKYFSNKDLDSLSELFAEDIRLEDWEIAEATKEKVVEANKKIFDSVESIIVKPLYFYYDNEDSFAVEILIVINDNEFLEVVDIIRFNEDGLIDSVKAYKK